VVLAEADELARSMPPSSVAPLSLPRRARPLLLVLATTLAVIFLPVERLHASAPEPEKKVEKPAEPEKKAEVEKKPETEAKPEPKARFTLQLSSFQDKNEAQTYLDSIKASGYQAYVTEGEVDGKQFFRVRMGSYKSLEAANEAKSEFEKSAKKSAKKAAKKGGKRSAAKKSSKSKGRAASRRTGGGARKKAAKKSSKKKSSRRATKKGRGGSKRRR